MGWIIWARRNLFPTPLSTVLSVVLGILLLWGLARVVDWALIKAVWTADNEACHQLDYTGACWGVVAEKHRLILFGRYPYDEQWRALLATLLLGGTLIASAYHRCWRRWLVWVWALVLLAFFALMRGGFAGLPLVDSGMWGGFPLTLILSVIGIGAAFPLGVLLALGRRSGLPVIRSFSVLYIELVRGVPLVTVLFMASFLFPLFMPQGMEIDVLVRIFLAVILFQAAYIAEVVRGGLQALPTGQYEAAASLGLSYWQTTRQIVLPQALRIVVPALVNSLLATFMDTSLVTIVSLYDLTGALRLALGDATWRPFFLEAYLFVGLVYFGCCLAMARYSRWVERYLQRGLHD